MFDVYKRAKKYHGLFLMKITDNRNRIVTKDIYNIDYINRTCVFSKYSLDNNRWMTNGLYPLDCGKFDVRTVSVSKHAGIVPSFEKETDEEFFLITMAGVTLGFSCIMPGLLFFDYHDYFTENLVVTQDDDEYKRLPSGKGFTLLVSPEGKIRAAKRRLDESMVMKVKELDQLFD